MSQNPTFLDLLMMSHQDQFHQMVETLWNVVPLEYHDNPLILVTIINYVAACLGQLKEEIQAMTSLMGQLCFTQQSDTNLSEQGSHHLIALIEEQSSLMLEIQVINSFYSQRLLVTKPLTINSLQ